MSGVVCVKRGAVIEAEKSFNTQVLIGRISV
jgi:hypothetical protein